MDRVIPANDAYQRVKKNEPVTRGTHDPHAQRFGSKEEDWLFGNRCLWPLVVSYIIADYRQGNSDTGEDPSASHVKSGSSVTNEAPVNEIGTKCYYCIASETHAPHLHNVRLCTCAFRSDRGIGSTSTESATVLNASSSAPRFDPTQLLRRSTYSSDDLVPVNGPSLSVAGMAVSRPRHNAMDLLPLSRFSMAGTGAAPYNRPRSIPSSYASGLPREGISSIRPVVRRDDPKGKRPASTNDEGSLMTARGIPPLTPRSPRGPSAPPSPSDLSTAESGSDDDEVTLAGDVDDDQSCHTTAPSASSGVRLRQAARAASHAAATRQSTIPTRTLQRPAGFTNAGAWKQAGGERAPRHNLLQNEHAVPTSSQGQPTTIPEPCQNPLCPMETP